MWTSITISDDLSWICFEVFHILPKFSVEIYLNFCDRMPFKSCAATNALSFNELRIVGFQPINAWFWEGNLTHTLHTLQKYNITTLQNILLQNYGIPYNITMSQHVKYYSNHPYNITINNVLQFYCIFYTSIQHILQYNKTLPESQVLT